MPIQKWSDQIWVAQLGNDPGMSDDFDYLTQQAGPSGDLPDLVVDLSGVRHFNSSHLSKLLKLRKALIERDTELRLAGPNDSIWAVFLATGLDKLFDFTADTTTALTELQMDRPD